MRVGDGVDVGRRVNLITTLVWVAVGGTGLDKNWQSPIVTGNSKLMKIRGILNKCGIKPPTSLSDVQA
jgi:hypothetical protein